MPSYTVYRADDGAKKRLVVEVSLPGITSGADLIVSVREAEASLYVRAPGRYKLSVPLGVPVDGVAEAVKFVRKKAILKVGAVVLPRIAPTMNGEPTQTMQDQYISLLRCRRP